MCLLQCRDPNTALGPPNRAISRSVVLEGPKRKASTDRKAAEVTRGDSEGSLTLREDQRFHCVDIQEVSPDVRQRFLLSPAASHIVVPDCVESSNGKVLHGCLLHDSQSLT